MNDQQLSLVCPRCAAAASVCLVVVPTMGDSGLSVVAYECPNGCDDADTLAAVDSALGIRHDLG